MRDRQALLHSIARQESGLQHRARIGGVGATRDRRDDDIAVAEAAADIGHVNPPIMRAKSVERLRHLVECNAILRARGAGDGRAQCIEIEVDDTIERQRLVADIPQLKLLGHALDPRQQLRRAAILLEIVEGVLIDGKISTGCAVFGRHVGDGRAIRHGKTGERRPEKFHELIDDPDLAQQFGHVESKSVADAPA